MFQWESRTLTCAGKKKDSGKLLKGKITIYEFVTKKRRQKSTVLYKEDTFLGPKLYCFKGNLGLKEGKYQNLEINLISPCKWKVSNSHSLIQCLMVKMYFRGRNNEPGITYNTRDCENIAGRLAHISQTFSKPWILHWQELPSYNGLTSWFCTSDIDVLLHL